MSSKTGPGRSQARTEDTRRAILDTAVELYLSQGTDNTTVSEIIELAGIGRTTFYRYFKDADEVLNQAVIRDFDGLMADFETQRYEHVGLEEQIIDDIVWFIRQLRRRPALKLLFANNSAQLYERIDDSLAACYKAALACSRPTYERARRQGRLRENITLEKYVEWCMFIVMSLQTVNFPIASNEFRLREMLKDFVAPSLIIGLEESKGASADTEESVSEGAVERLLGSDG